MGDKHAPCGLKLPWDRRLVTVPVLHAEKKTTVEILIWCAINIHIMSSDKSNIKISYFFYL